MEEVAAQVLEGLFRMCKRVTREQAGFGSYVSDMRWIHGSRTDIKHRPRYFGAFAAHTLRRFYKTFDDSLIQFILDSCESNQLRPDQPSTNAKTLADIPAPIFYLMFSNTAIVQDARILGLLRTHVPSDPVLGWPTDSPAAGLLLLLMEKTPAVRSWAMLQVNVYTRRPIPQEQFTTVHFDVLEMSTHAISPPTSSPEPSFFSDDLVALWKGYSTMLRFTPEQWLRPSKSTHLDIRHTVITHLSDNGPREWIESSAFVYK